MGLEYDLVVIGSGPGGQKAAIAAAKLGKSVAVIERGHMIGGVCVNTGTILLAQTESQLASVLAHEISHVTQHHVTRGMASQQTRQTRHESCTDDQRNVTFAGHIVQPPKPPGGFRGPTALISEVSGNLGPSTLCFQREDRKSVV